MISVKIFAPVWCNRDKLDNRGYTALPEGAMLSDALKAIKMPRLMGKVFQAAINGETVPLDTKLCDGDVIGFFSLATGG
ncbi:MAG: MoaD/ThiS family protein [Oscillospiraceae bacterium]